MRRLRSGSDTESVQDLASSHGLLWAGLLAPGTLRAPPHPWLSWGPTQRMPPGPAGTLTTLVTWNGLVLRCGDYVDILVSFPGSSGFPLRPPLPGRAQKKQDKRQPWNLSLSSLPRADGFPRRSRGPLPCLREPGTCAEGLPSVVGLISLRHMARFPCNW